MSKETTEFPEGSIQKETKPNNKRKVVFWSLLASGVGVIIIVALLLIFLLPKEEKYEIELSSNVSVEGEVLTGDGSYKKGESITIVAEEITGYRFTGWSFNGNIISTDKEYTFIIGEDTEGEYTANYDKLYSILVEDVHNSVSIEGNKTQAIEDEKVEFTITPNPDYRFISVKVNEDTLIESDGKYTFNMPAEDVTISVTYAEEYAITIDSSVSDMVTSVSLDKAISGEQVVVTANIEDTVTEDYVIMSDGPLYYIENGSEEKVTINKTEGQYSFTMPANDITIGVVSQFYRRLDDFTFSGNAITGYTGSATELTLPSYYETVSINSQDYTVEKNTGTEITEIGEIAFQDCTSLSSITIPEGVTTIGDSAFRDCTSLSSITIPEGVTTIGDSAFSGCDSLSSITIPETVISIGGSAFSGCSNLITVDFGTNSQLQSIGYYAFSRCTRLSSIVIPAEVTSIGYSAFVDCYSLSIVYNNSSLEINVDYGNGYVGSYAYEVVNTGETAQGKIEEINNVQYYINDITQEKVALFAIDRSVSSISLEEDTTSINQYAFSECRNLISINIPSGVTIIGDYAFEYCCSLALVINNSSNITITKGDYGNGYVGYYAYEVVNTGETAQGRIEKINEVQYYINDITQEKVALSAIDRSVSSISLEEDTTSINQRAFSGCSNLITVDFGTNSQLQSIGYYAFSDCTSLSSITIPSGVTIIGDSAFLNCTSLSSITIPSGVTSIGSDAFYVCYSLAIVVNNSSSITITKGDSGNGWVGSYAYEVVNVNAGESVQGSIEEINNVRYYINDITQEKVALSAIDRSVSSISLEEDTTSINQYAFSECRNLISINIPSGVTIIGDYAFYQCPNLTTVNFGDNSQLQSIGNSAFSNCTSLSSITIPSGVTIIGDWAFYGCTRLSSITIPSGVTRIGDWAFVGCTNLTSVTIESDDIYKAADGTDSHQAGGLLANATTVRVLTSIVEANDNSYLENTSNFDTSTEGEYTVFSKKVTQ